MRAVFVVRVHSQWNGRPMSFHRTNVNFVTVNARLPIAHVRIKTKLTNCIWFIRFHLTGVFNCDMFPLIKFPFESKLICGKIT